MSTVVVSAVLDALVARAFSRANAAEANTAIEAVRALQEAQGHQAFSYELFVPTANHDEFLLTVALPKLVSFLDSRGFRGASTPGVFLSLFTADGLHFIEAGAALEVLAGFRQLTVSELYSRSRDGGAREPLRLGP
jgi:hypothetical protein